MIGTDTKAQILSAAIELFALNGYEKTTMRDIAEKVAIRSASIYYFFRSKESLLEAIFAEFAENFSKYRTPPEAIFAAAQTQPLAEVLGMLFYTFGEPGERERIMAISRIILSLQYENAAAQALYQRVFVQEAMSYGVEVFQGLYAMGLLKKVDFQWVTYIFHAFAVALFEETLRHFDPRFPNNRAYKAGIQYICANFGAAIMAQGGEG